MRQTDSLSFVLQYYNNGFDFFNPKLFNLKNIEGRAICEFPVIYYLTALLFLVFGKHFFLLKLVNLIISYAGIYCLFRLAYHFLKDFLYAFLICMFLLTSTVFNYYSFNYLPDTAALGFTFIAWYFWYKFRQNKINKNIIAAILFFTLASLIKVTYLINPLSILVYNLLIINKNKKLSLKTTFYFSLIVIIVIIWNIYVIYYNALYHSTSFITRAFPVWNLTSEKISIVWDYISTYWYSKYFAYSSFHMILLLAILQILSKKARTNLFWNILVLLAGSVAILILFYSQFKDHDYYFLIFMPLFAFLLINGIITLQEIFKKQVYHIIFKIIFLIIVVVGINYSRMKLAERYSNRIDDFSQIGFLISKNLDNINKLNIPGNAKFIVAPDKCQNGGLLFLNKTGWNIKNYSEITPEKINVYKHLGAEYLLLSTEKKEIQNTAKKTGVLIYKGEGVSIYKLQ